jgi:hypothetical protein
VGLRHYPRVLGAGRVVTRERRRVTTLIGELAGGLRLTLARNGAKVCAGLLLESPSILGIARSAESLLAAWIRVVTQSTNKSAGSFSSITGSRTGGPMADVNDALAANRAAVIDLVAAAERSAATWTTPRAPGKWSPSQVVEHVAGGLEEAANALSGAPSIPMPPLSCARCSDCTSTGS